MEDESHGLDKTHIFMSKKNIKYEQEELLPASLIMVLAVLLSFYCCVAWHSGYHRTLQAAWNLQPTGIDWLLSMVYTVQCVTSNTISTRTRNTHLVAGMANWLALE